MCGASADACLIVSSIYSRLPSFRRAKIPGIPGSLFSGYQLKFTRVKILNDEKHVASQQEKSAC
ncbi:hypothetical protein DXT96_23580 [Agrobacterium sp. ICMP 6402]|nr:hypothetical protein [Agrobacterium sp. ICMP 6402]